MDFVLLPYAGMNRIRFKGTLSAAGTRGTPSIDEATLKQASDQCNPSPKSSTV